MAELLIKGGRVVSPDRTVVADVAIEGGKIKAIGPNLDIQASRVVDASGKYVVPGGVDTHVHLKLPFMGTYTADDYYQGTLAAAFGGTTTVIDFAIQGKGQGLIEALENRLAGFEGQAVVDYAMHSVMTDPSDRAMKEIKALVDAGVPSMKVFMVYRKEGLMADDAVLLKLCEGAAEHGLLPGVHAENAAMAEYNVDKFLAEGKTSAIYHALHKPPVTEAEAINRAIFVAMYVGAGMHIYHMSTKEGVELVREAREKGKPVYAETCTHYLTLTDQVYERADGINWICSPPIRKQADIEKMWEGLRNGWVSTVGSDEAAFDSKQKKMGDTFATVPNGCPGVELRLPVVFSEGVSKGRISVEKFVEITSTNGAKMFGLYPQKGIIAEGSDADVVIIDPKVERVLTYKDLHMAVDWCPLEGWKVQGYPVITICRGEVVVEEGRFLGKTGYGRFVKGRLDPAILKGPVV